LVSKDGSNTGFISGQTLLRYVGGVRDYFSDGLEEFNMEGCVDFPGFWKNNSHSYRGDYLVDFKRPDHFDITFLDWSAEVKVLSIEHY
jgi:hypothetical protein